MIFIGKRLVVFDAHASFRIAERAQQYNLTREETKRRIIKTVQQGNVSMKHYSKIYKTFQGYFHDNLTFYAVCDIRRIRIIIRTVIIEHGRT